ncbi:LysR family transcriptional regulator [Saccharopolyspora sp. K220]|uniref:LysR family transcriptional regulator n=1 Tax=Saccharopolyspora soli TaxID=2926618 RepID=UPI001F57935B|nr:LysR family transcriptional regulator [Saccharopolyspora soli]MCI2416753.1 LysR family transcriptional regulator [Saccharopolyspora soli]
MDIGWLESFLALAEHESFTRAAAAQHISQPAFSRRIRALELWFGGALVDRSTFPVALTPAGAKVRASAIQTMAGLGAIREEIRGRQRTPRGAVRIAATHTLATTFFPAWWARFGDQRAVPCSLLPADTLDGYDMLLHGGCDLLLAYADPAGPPAVPDTEAEWLAVATDRLAPYSSVTAGQVDFTLPGTASDPVPVVLHGQGAFLGRVTDRLLAGHDLHLSPIVQSDLTSALASLVYAGMGVGWLPDDLAAPGVAAGTLRQVGGASLSAELEIRLYRARRERMPRRVATVWHSAAGLAEKSAYPAAHGCVATYARPSRSW